MDAAWVGVIGALAGVIIASLTEAWRSRGTFRREKGWLVDEERRQRLEKAYEALEELHESYARAYADALYAVSQQKVPQELCSQKVPWARLRMLVHLYAPELVPKLQEVDRTGPVLGRTLADAVMLSSLDGVKNARLVDAMDVALGDLTKAVDAMRDGIVQQSQCIGQRRAKAAGSHAS